VRARLRRRVHLTPADRERSIFTTVPFEVPAGTSRIEVTYRYEGQGRAGASSVVDLGLIDPRGSAFPQFPGFRGWSGSARTSVVLTPEGATPGYLPGPLVPGTWQVLLGLSRVPPEGIEVEVMADTWEETGQPPHPLPGPPQSGPAERGRGWYAGDLHAHTHHSDAPGSLTELVEEAIQAGLDFLAVTDHNTVSHLPYLRASSDRILLVPGEEVTTAHGHMNAWGLDRLVDFRWQTEAELRAVIEEARARGCVLSLSHPLIPGMSWTLGYDLPVDALEVWHGPSGERNLETLAIWQELLRSGRRMVGLGGSDHHCGRRDRPLANPTIWVLADSLTVEGIVSALRSGRVVITTAGTPPPRLVAERNGHFWEIGDIVPPGGPVRVHCPAGTRLVTARGEVAPETELDLLEHGFVRGELWEHGQRWPPIALTNPIWGHA
jgi:hypothetical protein